MRPVNGLYVLRIGIQPAKSSAPSKDSERETEPPTPCSSPCDDRLVLILRLRFHGARAGGISGSARVVSLHSRSETVPRATLTHEGAWSTDAEGAISLLFSVLLDHVDGAVLLGESSNTPLTNVTLQFPGTMAGRIFVGSVTVIQGGTVTSHAPEQGRLRAAMREYLSKRCAKCQEPVEFGRSPCPSPCGGVEYCSAACQVAHHAHYTRISRVLSLRYMGPHAAQCTVTFSGVEFSVYWAAVKNPNLGTLGTASTSSFTVLVDAANPLGVAYELRLDVLVDARAGCAITFINADDGVPLPSDTQILSQNANVFESLVYSAVERGCAALAAVCLNHLFRWCDFSEFVERLYVHFYELCVGVCWEGQRVMSSLSEYIVIVRPMYEGCCVLIEAALKSLTPCDFWFRVETAKGLLVTLYNFNGSVVFTDAVQDLRSTIVPEQQRQTLLLLARVFLMMAARTGKENATKMLKRAEECFRDALDEDKCRANHTSAAPTMMQLSALYLTSSSLEDQVKAKDAQQQGEEMLQKPPSTDVSNNAIITLAALVDAELTRGAVNPSNESTDATTRDVAV